MMNDITPEKWQELVLRAWTDEVYRRRLVEDPRSVLHQEGVSVAPDMDLVVLEDTPRRVHLVIPNPPVVDLSVAALEEDALSDYDPGF